jgi:hypothetical protein
MKLLDKIKSTLSFSKRKARRKYFRYMLVVELEGNGYIFAFSQDLKIVRDLKTEILDYYNQLLLQYDGLNMLRENAMYNFWYKVIQTGKYGSSATIDSFCNDTYSVYIFDMEHDAYTEPSNPSKWGVSVAIYVFFLFIHFISMLSGNNFNQRPTQNLSFYSNSTNGNFPLDSLLYDPLNSISKTESTKGDTTITGAYF